MNVPEIIASLKSGLTWVGLGALLLIAAACAYVGMRRVSNALWVRLRPAAIGVFAVAAVIATCEAQKRSGATGTSRPAAALVGRRVLNAPITSEDIARGWRLESVVTNDAISYTMPMNGVEYRPWSLRGGYETHFPLDLEFGFPFGTNVVRRLDVISGGTVESLPRQRVGGAYHSAMSICAAREYASIVPDVGRFWWAGRRDGDIAPYQAMLLTWEGVYAGKDRTGQYDAQIELRGDGNFVTRSNNVERVYRRVLAFDWDNDGLPNTIDPAPETPLVPSAWNQSEEWAAAAFPSNAAEIVAAGGYAAWTAERAEEPDRRLVTLGIAFDDGGAWPAMLDFGGVPVVADGGEGLAFAIDCGAKVPFTLTSGRLGSVEVRRREDTPPYQPDMVGRVVPNAPPRRGDALADVLVPLLTSFPYEFSVGDVTVHLDGPRSGWLCRFAAVYVDSGDLSHLFPGDTIELTASVTCCHPDSYLGCTWRGGEGIAFSNPHSLTTDVTYASAPAVEWGTNGIDLVTQFAGYALTNHLPVTVGTDVEPPLRLTLGCQDVFFLNDAELESSSNRAERIRPVTLNLTGPAGTNGTVRLSVDGDAAPVLLHVVDGVTNRVTEATEIPLAVTDGFAHTGSCTVYASCPSLGTGTITASFTPADGGETLTASAAFRCVEPLRKLVTTERAPDGRFVNPSRLVMGTNAVLKVGANGNFSPSEVDWRVVSGPGRITATYGWYATVEPTGTDTVTVEARFNDDEIQPRFVLPVVMPRTIPVRAFVVEPPEGSEGDEWKDNEINVMLDTANEIFTQVGIRFELAAEPESVGTTNDWNLLQAVPVTNANGRVTSQDTVQFTNLVGNYTARDCVKVYFLGALQDESASAMKTSSGILVTKMAAENTLAHELGHVLGLNDCFWRRRRDRRPTVYLPSANDTVDHAFFLFSENDWGLESGRGFYEKSDTIKAVMSGMLMYGVGNGVKADIPNGVVFSLRRNATSPQRTFYPHVGADYIVPNNQEVYSR